MWALIKYCINDTNSRSQVGSGGEEKAREDVLLDDPLKPIKDYIEKYAENYLISLHYLEYPIIIAYCSKRPEQNNNFKIVQEVIEWSKEILRILMNEDCEYVKGFAFIQKNVAIRKYILQSKDQYTFDMRAANSGLETYVINDLRVTWKNTRYKYLMECLPETTEVLYNVDKTHPLYNYFLSYLKNIYKRGVDRFKTFICVGSSFIGKSVFFTKFIVPEKYYIYHSNNLEYSKMPDQPNKIFRILDDINWSSVSNTELKALMNRNISSVNIKYGYEYIFPLIPVIIMNKEDYKNFRTQFTDIWEFIERNAVIYPPQTSELCIQEEKKLFTDELVDEENMEYLFNEIMNVEELKRYDGKNINEWIKNELDRNRGYEYDTSRYIQIPEVVRYNIPNPEISKRSILEQYEKFLLRKKEDNMKNENNEEKKPWYKNFWNSEGGTYNRYNNARIGYNKKESKSDAKDVIDKSSFSDDFNSSDTSFDSFSGEKYGKDIYDDDDDDNRGGYNNSGSDTINSSSDLSDGSETSFDNFGKSVL